MAIANYFYNQTTRRYVALFGNLFNQLTIERSTNDGSVTQKMIVPLSYAPFQKVLARITQDPDLLNSRRPAITLPRISFEITSMQYDPARKLASTRKVRKENKPETDGERSFVYNPVPYNIDFSLYIMTKYSEDATKIMEQILPFFTPDWTVTARMIDDLDPIDIPIILNSVSTEELYEGDFIERQTVLYTLTFTLKGWYFGPEKERKVIKFIDTRYATTIAASAAFEETVEIYPIDLANTSIEWFDIEFDDEWVVSTNYINQNGAPEPFLLDIVTSNTDMETSNSANIDLQSGYAIDDLNNPQT
jgi:hypothetical protein